MIPKIFLLGVYITVLHFTGDTKRNRATLAEIYSLCGPENEMIPDLPDGRHIYVVGGVIIKGHHEVHSEIQEHTFGDANEAAAIALVNEHFPWIPLPSIYFHGKVSYVL